uniref:CUB domain-containing protein n=1 Tax=Panagrolaimus davidi TaxID=227884 RepID=A0A914Q901_9BILA
MVNGRGFSEHVEIRSWASHDQYLPWNTKSEILLFKSHFSHDWTAFEGAVLAYNVSLLNSCPFENETIYIEEGKIVPITTTYDLYGPPKNCTFIFSINKETQLLKIVVRTVYVEKNQYYETTHGKGMQKMYNIKFRETPPSVAYLKSNNNGIVTFHLPVGHFLALASVVKKDVTYAKNECKTTLNGNVTNVFNLDYEIGYAPYEICEYIITVENDSEVLLKPDKLYIEQHADELLLEESSGNKTYINNLHQVFMLSKDASQTVIRFKSDGNIQQPGFILHLKTVGKYFESFEKKFYNVVLIECKCGESNIIVPCEGKMTILPAINSEYYCSNMQCNYTISMEQSCDRTYFKLDIHARLNGNDRLKLFVKDTFKESIFTNGARTFLSNARISLTFVSQNSKAVRPAGHWKIYAFTTEPPWSKKTWFLNSTSSAQAFWLDDLSEKREYTICGTNDEVLEMFVAGKTSLLSYYNLFDSNKMDNFVSS